MGKEIPADIRHHLLGSLYHQPVISESRQRAAQVHDPHSDESIDEPSDIPGQDKLIDHRFQKVRARHVCPCAYKHEHRHKKQEPLVIPHVVK